MQDRAVVHILHDFWASVAYFIWVLVESVFEFLIPFYNRVELVILRYLFPFDYH